MNIQLLDVRLVDDDTLDTVVSVNGEKFRFKYDGCDDALPYSEFLEWAKKDAVEQYQEMLVD